MAHKQLDLSHYGSIPIEYGMLAASLSTYASPKDKIDSMAEQGLVIRLKKGLYVVSLNSTNASYDKDVIANNLYGPSYVSLETALSAHGMIPEGVFSTRSVTPKRTKRYLNGVGCFEYLKVPEDYYPLGISITTTALGNSCLMATPEKALCDLLYFLRGHRIQSKKAMRVFLFDDMRIDVSSFESFDHTIFEQVIGLGKKSEVYRLLLEVLEDELRN